MDLHATPLKGIVQTPEKGFFYLLPLQDLSALQTLKGHLTCAIDVLSNPEGSGAEQRLDAIHTLNSLVAALSIHDSDHYEAMDVALDESIHL